MKLYLEDELVERNIESSPLGVDSEPYDFDERSPSAFRAVMSVVLVVVLVVAAALGGWFAKGWFVQSDIEAANKAANEATERAATSAYGQGYRDGYSHLYEVLGYGTKGIKNPEETPSIKDKVDMDRVFCGLFANAQSVPYVRLGNTSYWIIPGTPEQIDQFNQLVVGHTYSFQFDVETTSVFAINEGDNAALIPTGC